MPVIPENTQIGADGERYPIGLGAPDEFSSENLTIGTSLSVAYTSGPRARFQGETVTIQNLSATAVVTVGDDDVGLSTNGVVLSAQYDSVTIPLHNAGVVVYVISDTASTPISVTVA